jgi:quercetin dioxygenase-like cupin family protein
MNRLEVLTRVTHPFSEELAPGVGLRVLASGALGAQGLTTALASFRPGAELPYHKHPFSEVIVVLEGEATVLVQGRRYRLRPFDAMHLPAGTAHAVRGPSAGNPGSVLHSSFASDVPTREAVTTEFPQVGQDEPEAGAPEKLVRFEAAPVYELAPRAFFRDLFARRLGARGVCGGYGLFEPGASLPCHFHGFDESITIVAGEAVCQVAGQEYRVANYDTACIPRGRPHRFLNRSDGPMAMIWVYAGDEPDRVLVDPGYCEGGLPLAGLPGASL